MSTSHDRIPLPRDAGRLVALELRLSFANLTLIEVSRNCFGMHCGIIHKQPIPMHLASRTFVRASYTEWARIIRGHDQGSGP